MCLKVFFSWWGSTGYNKGRIRKLVHGSGFCSFCSQSIFRCARKRNTSSISFRDSRHCPLIWIPVIVWGRDSRERFHCCSKKECTNISRLQTSVGNTFQHQETTEMLAQKVPPEKKQDQLHAAGGSCGWMMGGKLDGCSLDKTWLSPYGGVDSVGFGHLGWEILHFWVCCHLEFCHWS